MIYKKWYCKQIITVKIWHDDTLQKKGYSGISISPCLGEATRSLETTLI